ncbi:hypothetical protein F5888DRAFT_757154 [Russula emetica]|nr:hypothetical protein F5888DRAFT_757154 [Russula emetica]
MTHILGCTSTISQIRELESQLDFYRRHYPGPRELALDNARANSPTSEDRANGGRSNQGNPLPSPPKPKCIPPVPSQPYVHQTGAGAVFYEGASYDERVVPPAVRDMASRDAPSERERARSRSGHRDHSAERRNRRREGESDKTRRRRDHRRRDTLEGAVDPSVLPSEPVLGGNALGFHTLSLRPGQDQYSMPPAPPVTSDPSTSRARRGSSSRPPTSHGMAPPVAGTASAGSAYRDASHSNGAGSFYSHRGDGLANPSMNSLGLSERLRDVSSTYSQATRPVSASIPPTARDSVSSWADGGLPPNDLLPRPDGQLLGVGRYAPIATPQPQLPQAYRDTDSRSYSRHAQLPAFSIASVASL